MISDPEMLRLYGKLLALRRETAARLSQDRIIRHSDYLLPNSYPLNCLVFGQMTSNFTRSLIGEVNRFFIDVHHADCWIRVVSDYEDKVSLLWEFAEPLLELSVGRPYSLKSHFSFAVVHLLNQFNSRQNKKWKDSVPDDRDIDFVYLRKNREVLCPNRKSFDCFLEALTQLNDKTFTGATQNFRNLLQHRFRLRFDTGLTPHFERKQTKTGVSYTYKIAPPLQLDLLVPVLYGQHEQAVGVFKAYWVFLNELTSELGATRNMDCPIPCLPINVCTLD